MNTAVGRLEFCGGIGSGKSTVARLLAAHYALPFVEEHYQEVPFWKEFYQDPESFNFEKNISFLLFHSNAVRAVTSSNRRRLPVCDFALFQDLAYAAMSGKSADYLATVAVHARLAERLGPPALIIRVTCPIETQLERIAMRGREPERAITAHYLEDLDEAITSELAIHHADVPLIEVDTASLDFTHDPSAGLDYLAGRLAPWIGARHS
ncbi:MAG TPA: deoxynucleoside kinase [Allosphingosinicella sp.]|jgi:deoxyadenosine/deoxycytidine kinase